MNPPPHYYGWSLAVNIFVAVGTVGSVFVALFGSWMRSKFFPPKLMLKLLNTEGERINLTNPVPALAQSGAPGDVARYYHLQVSNGRRWSPANDLDVRIVRVDTPAPAGEFSTELYNVAIHLRNQAIHPLDTASGVRWISMFAVY